MNAKHMMKWIVAAIVLVPSTALAQFNSGSNGSDGALTFPAGASNWDPQAAGLDPDNDGVYHFTTINLPAGATVNVRANGGRLLEGRPVIWLATGAVTIGGNLILDGSAGHSSSAIAAPSTPGPGGFAGGVGGTVAQNTPRAGSGPGGGLSRVSVHGGHAGHSAPGDDFGAITAAFGPAYGNAFLLPLVGGSGGGGGSANATTNGGGGGAGGGAILIASNTSVTLSGQILSRGGCAGSGASNGGEGSGGAVRIISPSILGAGSISVGTACSNYGSPGRVRIESNNSPSVSVSPISVASVSSPGPVFPPASAPTVRVTSVGGVAVAMSPTGSFVVPDAAINTASPVSMNIAASGIPLGTQINLRVIQENGTSVSILSTALAGTLANSTATAGPITFATGFTRVYATATWTP
jgi:hypothetical protein